MTNQPPMSPQTKYRLWTTGQNAFKNWQDDKIINITADTEVRIWHLKQILDFRPETNGDNNCLCKTVHHQNQNHCVYMPNEHICEKASAAKKMGRTMQITQEI